MQYQVIVLDLDGTLTNSKKEITEPTRQALIDIQKNGKTVVLASGRPINGVAPLAKQLRLQDFGGYMLSFNGARVTRCSDGKIIYNKQIPPEMIRPICDIVRSYAEQGVDLITYTDTTIISAIAPNQYTRIESGINRMEIYQPDDFVSYIDFPINKLLVPGPADVLQELMKLLKEKYHGLLNIYLSEPYFLEIMPQNIDKAHSLQKLLNSIGLTAFRSGSWARITAENTSTHPTNSLTESLSPKMTHPASTANTDSRLINNDATVGSVFFCAMI